MEDDETSSEEESQKKTLREMMLEEIEEESKGEIIFETSSEEDLSEETMEKEISSQDNIKDNIIKIEIEIVKNEEDVIKIKKQVILKKYNEINLTKEDYNSLNKGKWVSSKIIECFLKYIIEIKNVWNPLFLETLVIYEDKFYKYGESFFKKYDKIIIPILLNSHWLFAIFDKIHNILYIYDSMKKSIYYYNNELDLFLKFLSKKHQNFIEQNKKILINISYKRKGFKISYKINLNTKIKIQKSPIQNDSYNCGIFLMKNIDLLKENSWKINTLNKYQYSFEDVNYYRKYIKEKIFGNKPKNHKRKKHFKNRINKKKFI